MKILIVLFLSLLSVNAFSKTTVYSFYGMDKKDGLDYFYASSFGKKFNYCYDGFPEEVCNEVKKGELITRREYQEGAHDYFKVTSCSRDHDEVTVESKLFDDYETDGEAHTAVFGACD